MIFDILQGLEFRCQWNTIALCIGLGRASILLILSGEAGHSAYHIFYFILILAELGQALS